MTNQVLEFPISGNLLSSEAKTYEVKTKVPDVRTTCLLQNAPDVYFGNLTLQFPILEEFKAAGMNADIFHNDLTRYLVSDVDMSEEVKESLFWRG